MIWLWKCFENIMKVVFMNTCDQLLMYIIVGALMLVYSRERDC